jgi:Rad3-related DNA helicase
MISTNSLLSYFPLEKPREKQQKALDFIKMAIERGYRHIVISAPTGLGKSAIGSTVCRWAASDEAAELEGQRGGYYLVTQKMLQDQLERDFTENPQFGCVSIKSAESYPCDNPAYKNCELGCKNKCGCSQYRPLKERFLTSQMGITNYAYFLTDQAYAGNLVKRKVLVLDEAHTVERLLLKQYEMTLCQTDLNDIDLGITLPLFKNMGQFVAWAGQEYVPNLQEKTAFFEKLVAEHADPTHLAKAKKLRNQLDRTAGAVNSMKQSPRDWVFWDTDLQEGKQYIARPLFARSLANLLFGAGDIVIHMSAFFGEKQNYCSTLGLHEDDVAWASFGSTFPVENRPIKVAAVGSMSRNNIDETLPRVVRQVSNIMDKHATQKGLIHCVSYKIGLAIYAGLRNTKHGHRLIFPQSADDRTRAFERHANSEEPTVLISPSMTEGYDFAGKLAEWQVIAKVPYPSLGDKHTCIRKDVDGNWYAVETIKTLLQASGRIVRSEKDVGTTYVLDSDFNGLLDRHSKLFPRWWLAAVKR